MKLETQKNGYLILGDVHAVYKPFSKAVAYAKEHNLTLVSIGDLIDNNEEGDLVVNDMLDLATNDDAVVIWGNHERKIFNFLCDLPVDIGPPNQITLDHFSVQPEYRMDFLILIDHLKDFVSIVGKPNNIFITHAAIHPKFWEGVIDDEVKDAFINGTVDRSELTEFKGQTYPLRTYDWCNHVPENHIVIVGHDPTPMKSKPLFDQFQSEPLVFENIRGGTVIFMDCGSGKGGDLYGAVVNKNADIVEYVNFGR